jgi:hypothetical protein
LKRNRASKYTSEWLSVMQVILDNSEVRMHQFQRALSWYGW